MHKYMEKMGEVTFDKIFNQRLGKCAVSSNRGEVGGLPAALVHLWCWMI